MMEWILTATVLMLAVLAVRAVLGRRMGPKLRYALWLLVLLRLLLPFSFWESAASPANLVRVQEEAMFVTPVVTAPPVDADTPVPSPDLSTPADPVPADSGPASPSVIGGGEEASTPYVSTFDLREMLRDLLPKLWVVGMAAAGSWFLFCNLLFYRNLRRSRKLLQVDGKLRIYLANAPSPCLFGLFRPAVYVTPEAAADEWMMEHTLLHEKTHFRHGDHIWAFLRTICLILWWYHPLVWVAARLSRQDSELFCDAAVIEALGEEHRAEYGRTLLALSSKGRASAFCAASTLSRGGRQLKSRITAIARWAKPKKWAIVLALLLAALAVGCAFSGASESTEAPADTDTPKADDFQVVTATDPAAETKRTPGPLTDEDLKGGEPVHLGMSFEQANAVLSLTEEELLGTAMGMQSYLRGDTLYTFRRDSMGWKQWFSGFSTQSDPDFLGLGIGVGSTLEELVAFLGCDIADDPGAGETWQLYGADSEINSAQVAPGEADGERFLAVWTENGSLLFQLQQDKVIQAEAQLDTSKPQLPVSDVDVASTDGLTPGMSYETALVRLEPMDRLQDVSNALHAEKGGILYLFRDQGNGMELMQYSTDVAGTELPLGLTIGGSIDAFLWNELGMAELPELPLQEDLYLYGSAESGQSCLLTAPYGDCAGDLQIYTEHYLFRCRLDENRTIIFADCSLLDAPAAEPDTAADDTADTAVPAEDVSSPERDALLARLAADDYFYNADVLGCVPFDDPGGRLAGVALCQRKNGIPWVVYMPKDPAEEPTPMGLGSGELDYVEGTFGYADGKAYLTVYDRNLEQELYYTVSHSEDGRAFTSQSSPLLLNRFSSYAMRVLDYQELPGNNGIDGVLVVSRDDSLILPMICYCLDVESTSSRFVFIPPVGDGTELEYQMGTLRALDDGTVTYDLVDPATGTLHTKTVQPGNDPTDATQYNQWFTR